MKFKPFAIRNMTTEQVQIMLDKSVEAGAKICDSLEKYPSDLYTFWGVHDSNETYTDDQLILFSRDCVEITFDQLDEHLGLVSAKEEVEEVPYEDNTTPEQSSTVTSKTVEMLAEELGDIIHVYPNGEYGVLGTGDVEISIKSLQQLERYVELVSELKSFEG